MFNFALETQKATTTLAKRAEPPKLNFIFNSRAWTPVKLNKGGGTAPLYMSAIVQANITAKTTNFPLFQFHSVKCPSSLLRNKAKNALSLAETISTILAGQK